MIPGYINQELRRYESQVSLAGSRISRADSLMDLVRSVNTRPHASVHLRCLSSVKAADSRLLHFAERRADELVSKRLEKIQGLVGSEDYCRAVGQLRQELRFLRPSIWRVAQAAERSLQAMEHVMDSRENFARERSGG